MHLVVDLHSHSGHAGGVGDVSLPAIAETMALKGIHVYGTGDCLQPQWLDDLEKMLKPVAGGLFQLPGIANSDARFILQSEIILTADVPCGGRKGVHTVLLFPSIASAREAQYLFGRWDVKLNMGRPFLKCADADDVAAKMTELAEVDAGIEIFPAHVLTPQGIFGSDHPVDRLSDFFGDFASQIHAVETGLSADPEILALIPELDTRTLLSNSDCHSAALNRVGREYTDLDVNSATYDEIIFAIRNRKVHLTAEFSPAEGRYFLTGHRSGKKDHEDSYCYYSPDTVPHDNICPICGKELTVGVLQRALELSRLQGEPRTLDKVKPKQKAIHMVPLIEVVAGAMGVRSITSKKVTTAFHDILNVTGTETLLWQRTADEIEKDLADVVSAEVLAGLLHVARDEFTFEPLGFDGAYGELKLGQKGDWFGHSVVVGQCKGGQQCLPI